MTAKFVLPDGAYWHGPWQIDRHLPGFLVWVRLYLEPGGPTGMRKRFVMLQTVRSG